MTPVTLYSLRVSFPLHIFPVCNLGEIFSFPAEWHTLQNGKDLNYVFSYNFNNSEGTVLFQVWFLHSICTDIIA